MRPGGTVAVDIGPGADVHYRRGHAIAEATHGTAPDRTKLATVIPGLAVHSADMMRRGIGWTAAADLITRGVQGAVATKTVAYGLQRLMEGAARRKRSEL